MHIAVAKWRRTRTRTHAHCNSQVKKKKKSIGDKEVCKDLQGKVAVISCAWIRSFPQELADCNNPFMIHTRIGIEFDTTLLLLLQRILPNYRHDIWKQGIITMVVMVVDDVFPVLGEFHHHHHHHQAAATHQQNPPLVAFEHGTWGC